MSYETQVHRVQYQYVDCGELKLTGLGIQLEDPSEHAGSKKNQEINTRNLIVLDYQLKEAEALLNCYRTNYLKLFKDVNEDSTVDSTSK